MRCTAARGAGTAAFVCTVREYACFFSVSRYFWSVTAPGRESSPAKNTPDFARYEKAIFAIRKLRSCARCGVAGRAFAAAAAGMPDEKQSHIFQRAKISGLYSKYNNNNTKQSPFILFECALRSKKATDRDPQAGSRRLDASGSLQHSIEVTSFSGSSSHRVG